MPDYRSKGVKDVVGDFLMSSSGGRSNHTSEERWMGLGQFGKLGNIFKYGKVVRVDNERNIMDVQWITDLGGRQMVAITQPAIGIEGMPIVSDVVLCGMRARSKNQVEPVPLCYFRQHAGFDRSYGLHPSGRRVSNRKLYPGERWFNSDQGSEMVLTDDVYISDSQLTSVKLNSTEQSIDTVSLAGRDSNAAVRRYEGLVVRNVDEDAVGNTEPYVADDGSIKTVVTWHKGNFISGDLALTEIREMIYDLSEGVLDPFDPPERYVNGEKQNPIMEIVKGNVVGYDSNKPGSYAQPLKFKVFSNPDDIESSPDFQILNQQDIDEVKTNATAYLLRMLQAEGANYPTTIAIDKQGHVNIHIAASSSDTSMGSSRSVELSTAGISKIAMGADGIGKSLDYTSKGGISMKVGSIKKEGNISLNAEYSGKIREVCNAGLDGIAKIGIINGDEIKKVGNRKISKVSALNRVEAGSMELTSLGSTIMESADNMSVSVGGTFDETISSSKTSKIYSGLKTTVNSPFLEGADSGYAKIDSIILGDVKEEVIAGQKEVTVGIGYSVTVGAEMSHDCVGTIDRKSGAGITDQSAASITTQSAEGITMDAGGNIKMNSGAGIDMVAPQINIGASPTGAGVITMLSHKCFYSGAPLVGCTTVFAGP